MDFLGFFGAALKPHKPKIGVWDSKKRAKSSMLQMRNNFLMFRNEISTLPLRFYFLFNLNPRKIGMNVKTVCTEGRREVGDRVKLMFCVCVA